MEHCHVPSGRRRPANHWGGPSHCQSTRTISLTGMLCVNGRLLPQQLLPPSMMMIIARDERSVDSALVCSGAYGQFPTPPVNRGKTNGADFKPIYKSKKSHCPRTLLPIISSSSSHSRKEKISKNMVKRRTRINSIKCQSPVDWIWARQKRSETLCESILTKEDEQEKR